MQKEPTKKAAGKRNAGANPPRKLSRAEKKQIAEVIRQAKGDGKAHTAQQTIPYLMPKIPDARSQRSSNPVWQRACAAVARFLSVSCGCLETSRRWLLTRRQHPSCAVSLN